MPLSEIRGQDRAVAKLRAALQGCRLHHAYLVTGVPGVGVPELAQRFAEALLCPNDPEGCGKCSACDRASRGLHPDLLRAGLDREAGNKEVKVEAVRALCGGLQLKASEAGRKVALLADADRLSPSAQNALLKTLEEPPPGTVLILACEAEERLLPTVRSRCSRITLGPLPESLLVERLTSGPGTRRLDAGEAGAVARMSRGSLARAESFGSGFRERREGLLSGVAALLRGRGKPEAGLAAVELAEQFAEDRERAIEAVEVLAMFLRDLLVIQGQAGPADAGEKPPVLLVPDQAAVLAELAVKVSPAQVLEGLAALNQAALALEGNGAARLQLEAAALHLGGLAA
jgi:DNA polymerase-3 subunit delta'